MHPLQIDSYLIESVLLQYIGFHIDLWRNKMAAKNNNKSKNTKKQMQAVLNDYQLMVPGLIYDHDKVESYLKKLEEKLTDRVIRFEKLESLPFLMELIRDDFSGKYTETSPETIINVLSALLYIIDKKGLIKSSDKKTFLIDADALIKYVQKENKKDLKEYSEWVKWVKPGTYPMIPELILDFKEEKSIPELTKRYEKLIEPTMAGKITEKVKDVVPDKVKTLVENAGHAVEQADLYKKVMELAADGFDILVKNAAKVTVSEEDVVKQINKTLKDNHIFTIEEVCYARSYDIQKAVNKFKTQNVLVALAEGGATGAAGLAGIPLNITSSLFIFYRAVQSIAMYYGYDVRNNPDELEIATSVFMQAMDPSSGSTSEMGDLIAKIMTMSEALVVKQTVGKGWTAMAERGGVCLLITQLRAMAHKAANKALAKAGKEGMESKLFEGVLNAIGKKLKQETVKKYATPFAAAITALMDVSTMNKVLEYADVFYNKRFLIEKQTRIELRENPEEAQDVDYEVIENNTNNE